MANLRKRGNGTWQVRWNQDGRAESQSFPAQAAAVEFRGLVDAASQRWPRGWVHDRGFVEQATSLTLAAWFARAIAARPGANGSTRSDYKRDFATHVPSWLADKAIETITREDVGRWLSELQERLAPKTIHNIHGMVSSVMKDAQVDGLIPRNPFAGRSKVVPIKHEEMTFLTPAEFATFLIYVIEPYRPLVMFLFGTGLRWAEATALRVEHVDLAGGRIFVTTAWKRQASGPDLSLEPKSARSRRTVVLTPRLVEILRPLVEGRENQNNLVFLNTRGERINSGTFYNTVWSKARENAEAAGFVKHPRIHDLRHSHASVLLSGGHPVLAVSRRLGHASIAITSDLYGHLDPKVDTALVDLLSDAGQ